VSALVGLVVGVIAFLVVAHTANRWFARHAAQPSLFANDTHEPTSAGEGLLAVAYVAVFVVLIVTTFAGCHLGSWLAHEISF